MEHLELALAELHEFNDRYKNNLSWHERSLINKSIDSLEELVYKISLDNEITINQNILNRVEFPEIKEEIRHNLKEAIADKKRYDLAKKLEYLN
ncbi:MAG: hypothetical protein QNJ38_10820 [Prochloraceae cyanobacterium]|nr:hypothetical protein [Prochloraceae cyanobacterium]